jgi:hypothetical protein
LVGEGDGNFGISIVKIKFRDNFVVGVIGDVCDMRIVRSKSFEDVVFGVEVEVDGVRNVVSHNIIAFLYYSFTLHQFSLNVHSYFQKKCN